MSDVAKRGFLYDYLDSWKRFKEMSLPDKKELYNRLTMEDI